MTTTQGPKRGLNHIRHDIEATEKAITVNETPLPQELRDAMIQRFGTERVAQMDADMIPHLAGLREKLAALRAEYAALDAVACGRCDGTGEYAGPTGFTRNGRPVCFACGGSGLRKGAHRHA